MPLMPLPGEWDVFLSQANPAVIATIRKDGSPHSVATWYDWQDGRIMLSMDARRIRLDHIRRDPRVALTVFDSKDWEVHLSLLGQVVEIRDDDGLEDVDRLAMQLHDHAVQRARPRPRDRVDGARTLAWLGPARKPRPALRTRIRMAP
jgi:PPOX class probable F420-dependent enzyme